MTADFRPPVAETARAWAYTASNQPGAEATPQRLEPVLVDIIERLLDLAVSDPFPALTARMLGARLADAPFDRLRMLAQASRSLLGFPAGPHGSLAATRWPFVASQAIDSYAQALQERALAQQHEHMSAAVSVRVREIKALQHRLAHEATHDALTDLANRTLLQDRVRAMASDPSKGIGLLLVDLDRFKQINDGYGHAVGDEVLIELGSRLREASPPEAVICRYGGDEFVLAVGSPHNTIGDLAQRIVAALRDPVWSSAGPVPVSASVGTSYSAAGELCDFGDLLRRADRAMYSAKTAGGRRFVPADHNEAAIRAAV